MTDRELLELAAKAAGYVIEIDRPYAEANENYLAHGIEPYAVEWNPLTDDGDAFRLAATLMLNTQIGRLDGTVVVTSNEDSRVFESEIWLSGDNPYAATRRAIVRAAAEIGKSMKETK